MRDRPPSRSAQRGVAALAVTLVLVVAMALGAAAMHRALVVEQRASANQYAATQAFEAAEAGLQWAEAQFNADRRLGADCQPVVDTAADSFRERYLRLDPATGSLAPRLAAGVPDGRPGCIGSTGGFSCRCPSGGAAALGRPAGDGPFPTFRVEFLAGSRPGTVRVVSTGCSSAVPPCLEALAGRADATARVEVTLGLLGALRVPPSARLTAGGAVDASAATFPRTGTAIRAGGAVTVDRSSGATAPVVRTDPALAAGRADGFFAGVFGLDKARWRAQPEVTRVVCRADCAAALAAAAADRSGAAMLWVDGDLALSGPFALGSSTHPVVLVVDGTARLSGAVALHGALYAGSVVWTDAGPGVGAGVAGVLVVEHDYGGNAAVSFADDPAAMTILTRLAGSFARVAGSWRDF